MLVILASPNIKKKQISVNFENIGKLILHTHTLYTYIMTGMEYTKYIRWNLWKITRMFKIYSDINV